MGKKQRERVLPSNSAQAIAKNLRVSPIKLNQVATSIRGMKAEKALAELTFSNKRISQSVKKVLESAIANAENNHDLDVDALVVAEAHVGKNMGMKRWKPRARGRVGKILKPFSQITIVVKEVEEAA